MKLLLDTCTFLWFVLGDESQLSARVRSAVDDPDNRVYLSAVSVIEIMIKHRLGHLPLPQPAERFIAAMRVEHQIETLPLCERASLLMNRLPMLHRDPFDRMLICQALADGLVLATNDEKILCYPVVTLW